MTRSAPAPFDALTTPLDDGVTLIEASAGTGKTFAITRLVLRLLLARKVASLSEILVVTFTEKATQELVTRIRRMLREADAVWSDEPPERIAANADLFLLREQYGAEGGAIIRAALGNLDELGVSTIHGFCQRMLAESALETRMPFRTTFVEDDTEPLLRAAMDWTRKRLLVDGTAAGAMVNADADIGAMVASYARRFRRQPGTTLAFDPYHAEQAIVADFVLSVDDTFNREKGRRHLLGFDDLLRRLSSVLTEEGPHGPLATRIRSRYRAALIDEFQDTDSTQFPIFSNAFHGCPLFLIGDPKQSVYGFRGADIQAYLAAADGAGRRYTLTSNYRSTPAYVAAVHALFTRAEKPFLYDEDRVDFPKVKAATHPKALPALAGDGRGAMVWWWVDKAIGNGKYVSKQLALDTILIATVNEIVRLTTDGLPHRCIAVLLRTNAVAQQVKQALDAAGVPSVIGGADDVLCSDEATELVRIAAGIASPYDHRAVSAALATRIWGSTAEQIATSVGDGGEQEWSRITTQFAVLRDLWRTRGVSAALGALLADRDTTGRLLSLPDGERRLTNVRHVIELLHGAAADEGIVAETVGEWVARELAVQNTPERRMQRLETDSEAVQILSMHKAKGLEFDVVFCPTLYDQTTLRSGPFGLTPVSARDGEAFVMDIGSAAHTERAAAMLLEEEAEALRLVYVALTRAVHRCYLAFGDIGQRDAASKSALGYLLRQADGGEIRDGLQAMVDASDGRMSLRALDADVDMDSATVVEQPRLEFAPQTLSLVPQQLDTWRITSFTGLVADAPDGHARDVADPAVLPEVAAVATGFRAFPGGAQAGIALHDIFERLDFARSDEAQVAALVQSSLASHGLTGNADIAEARQADVLAMLERTVTATVPGTDFALADISRSDTLREWRFDLSVSTTSPRRIADALAAHGSAHARAYAPRLHALRDAAMPGYLGGVIDLTFARDGQWWIVDWKSNQLGAADARYEPAFLGEVMMEAHYTLQYHLYLLAMHRFLRTRVPGYDPSRHWGGVAYAFLRGIGAGDAHGWFIDRPTPALLDALDAAVGHRT
ncbi:MAG: UvrD-helicase domain-containing protein [Gemmatimonadota bacterium]